MNFTTRFRTLLPKTAAFVIVPLLLELLAYLIRGDIFPKYLSIPVQFRDIGLVFLYYALLYAGASLIATVFFALIPIKVEWALPSLFFTAFLALTLSRLLPQDSGLSPARVIVFAISVILGVALFFFLKKRKFPVTRLFFASCIYSLSAAHLLPLG